MEGVYSQCHIAHVTMLTLQYIPSCMELCLCNSFFDCKMKGVSVACFLLILSVLLRAQAFHTNTRCEARHRDLLQETASFGRERGDTNFYDCCAVSSRMYFYCCCMSLYREQCFLRCTMTTITLLTCTKFKAKLLLPSIKHKYSILYCSQTKDLGQAYSGSLP